jgi:glycosyltransferase involved in cell wall biosynthesis
MSARVTILIAARNAAATIERAVASAVAEADCPILLVNDHSTDDTVARARAAAGRRLTVLDAPAPGGVAVARQTALDAVATEFAAWLDADDEWLPGRARRLSGALASGFDIACESIDLHDGPSGAWLRTLTVPAFLKKPGAAVRLFERNYLPGDTQVAFRPDVFRAAGGYNPAVVGPESFDLLLRAISSGARLWFGDAIGYRMHAYPASLSRNLSRQRDALTVALLGHDEGHVRRLYLSAGYSQRMAAWALVLLSQFRDDPLAALRHLETASPASGDPATILEVDGPWPYPEGWRRRFHRGTLLLQLGQWTEGIDELLAAETQRSSPEACNNLGVAYARIEQPGLARAYLTRAAAKMPGYLDAATNLRRRHPDRITTHPLRIESYREEYAA